MALCVVINADGTLAQTGQPVSECAGYVMVDASEHARSSLLDTLLSVPEPGVAGTWLVGAFGFVLGCNVLSSLAGSVVKALSTERD
ncbi:MAG TPA: hypothetical protein VGD30_16310 [Telluria sp.]